jgi:YesN/AraC family two-component response regulator
VGWGICGEATNGTDAIKKAKYLRLDLVLLDIRMPGVNGLEAASLIRQQLPGVKNPDHESH